MSVGIFQHISDFVSIIVNSIIPNVNKCNNDLLDIIKTNKIKNNISMFLDYLTQTENIKRLIFPDNNMGPILNNYKIYGINIENKNFIYTIENNEYNKINLYDLSISDLNTIAMQLTHKFSLIGKNYKLKMPNGEYDEYAAAVYMRRIVSNKNVFTIYNETGVSHDIKKWKLF